MDIRSVSLALLLILASASASLDAVVNIGGSEDVREVVMAHGGLKQCGNDGKALVRFHNSNGKSQYRILWGTPTAAALEVDIRKDRHFDSHSSAIIALGDLCSTFLSCEMAKLDCPKGKTSCVALSCFVLTKGDDDNLSRGPNRTLFSGYYPTFTETVSMVRMGSDGAALVCVHMEHWETDGAIGPPILGGRKRRRRLDTRKDFSSCALISVVENGGGSTLKVHGKNGAEIDTLPTIGSEDAFRLPMSAVDDLELALIDTNKAIVCYGDADDDRNKCLVLERNTDTNSVTSSAPTTYGDRVGTYTANPCVAAQLEDGKAVVCCESQAGLLAKGVTCRVASVGADNKLSFGTALTVGDTCFDLDLKCPRKAPVASASLSNPLHCEVVICRTQHPSVICDRLRLLGGTKLKRVETLWQTDDVEEESVDVVDLGLASHLPNGRLGLCWRTSEVSAGKCGVIEYSKANSGGSRRLSPVLSLFAAAVALTLLLR